MIICGAGVSEVDAMRIFSENCRHRHCAFLKIFSNAIEDFRKSSATQSGFLENSQQVAQTFLRIFSPRSKVFRKRAGIPRTLGWGLSPPYPHKRGTPPPPAGRPRGGFGCVFPDTHMPRRAPRGALRRGGLFMNRRENRESDQHRKPFFKCRV